MNTIFIRDQTLLNTLYLEEIYLIVSGSAWGSVNQEVSYKITSNPDRFYGHYIYQES